MEQGQEASRNYSLTGECSQHWIYQVPGPPSSPCNPACPVFQAAPSSAVSVPFSSLGWRNPPQTSCFPEEERGRRLSDSRAVPPGTFPALQNPLPGSADPQAPSLLLQDHACLWHKVSGNANHSSSTPGFYPHGEKALWKLLQSSCCAGKPLGCVHPCQERTRACSEQAEVMPRSTLAICHSRALENSAFTSGYQLVTRAAGRSRARI